MHEEQLTSITDDPYKELFDEKSQCTWAHIFHALIKKFPTDDVLRNENNSVTRAMKEEGEYEGKSAIRMSTNTLLYRHVFRKAYVFNRIFVG